MARTKPSKIAFLTGIFPLVSETFIIDQAADLKTAGITVSIFSFNRGPADFVSDRYREADLAAQTTYLDYPRSYYRRLRSAGPKLWRLVKCRPSLLLSIFNVRRYGLNAYSLRLLFWVEPWLGREQEFDLIHCHFGTVANKFLLIREILGIESPLVVTFYGYDASHILKQKGKHYYDRLAVLADGFIVMSENMKKRLIEYGLPANKITVLPVSIPVDTYPFRPRLKIDAASPAKFCSVGRFVEKKGFDDLFEALAIVKRERPGSFVCEVVGGGPLAETLARQISRLNLEQEVKFLGYRRIEEIILWFLDQHLFIQPSKTARNGDME